MTRQWFWKKVSCHPWYYRQTIFDIFTQLLYYSQRGSERIYFTVTCYVQGDLMTTSSTPQLDGFKFDPRFLAGHYDSLHFYQFTHSGALDWKFSQWGRTPQSLSQIDLQLNFSLGNQLTYFVSCPLQIHHDFFWLFQESVLQKWVPSSKVRQVNVDFQTPHGYVSPDLISVYEVAALLRSEVF